MYDIINPDYLGSESLPRKIEEYDAIIIGNIPLKPETAELLDNFVSQGGKLLVTGSSSSLNSLGVNRENELFPATQATYLKVSESDKNAFKEADFEHFTLMMMNSDFLKCRLKEGASGYFRLLPSNMYGPAEKTYYSEDQITEFPGAISYEYGKGSTVFIPWMLGSEYDAKGNYAHRAVFLGSLNNLLKIEKQVITNASPMIEITHLSNRNGAYEWLGMINHSGFMGTSVREPVTIYGTTIKFKPQKAVKEIRLLRSGLTASFSQSDGWIECNVPEVRDFEMLLCLYK